MILLVLLLGLVLWITVSEGRKALGTHTIATQLGAMEVFDIPHWPGQYRITMGRPLSWRSLFFSLPVAPGQLICLGNGRYRWEAQAG